VSLEDDYKFSLACAEGTVFARNMANTRGSEANPDWMEAQVREMLASRSSEAVKEIRVIKG